MTDSLPASMVARRDLLFLGAAAGHDAQRVGARPDFALDERGDCRTAWPRRPTNTAAPGYAVSVRYALPPRDLAGGRRPCRARDSALGAPWPPSACEPAPLAAAAP